MPRKIVLLLTLSWLLVAGCEDFKPFPLLTSLDDPAAPSGLGPSAPLPAESSSPRRILSISLDPSELALNAPSSHGSPEPGYVVEARVTARVAATEGTDHPVRWRSLDLTRVRVDETGLVRAVTDAPSGSTSVVVTSLEDERVTATLSVTITRASGLEVGVN